MEFLGTIPSIRILSSLFQVKNVKKGKWISLGGQPRRKFFNLFTSNFKHFKDQFFRVRVSEYEYPFFLDGKSRAKFPLYWNRFLKRLLSIDSYNLSQYEKVILDYLSQHLLSKKKFLSCTKLLK